MLPKTSRLLQLFLLTLLVSAIILTYPLAPDQMKIFVRPQPLPQAPPPPLAVTRSGSPANSTPSAASSTQASLSGLLTDQPSPANVTNSSQPRASRAPSIVPTKVLPGNVTSSQLPQQPRVLCWVPSIEKWIPDRIKAINETWVPRCDGHVFFINTTLKDKHSDIVSLEVKDGREHLATKSVAAFEYLYQHVLDKFDWFLKGDDDSFIVLENLRLLLSQYNATQPVYLGHLFKKHLKHGYMSGGAAYVLSREGLRRLVQDGFKKNACKAQSTDEDVEIGRCLEKVGVHPQESRDKLGKTAFHVDGPREIMGKEAPPSKADKDYKHFPSWTGRNCCSELSVSFHHMQPAEIRTLDHLLYRTTVYGRKPDYTKLRELFEAKDVPPL